MSLSVSDSIMKLGRLAYSNIVDELFIIYNTTTVKGILSILYNTCKQSGRKFSATLKKTNNGVYLSANEYVGHRITPITLLFMYLDTYKLMDISIVITELITEIPMVELLQLEFILNERFSLNFAIPIDKDTKIEYLIDKYAKELDEIKKESTTTYTLVDVDIDNAKRVYSLADGYTNKEYSQRDEEEDDEYEHQQDIINEQEEILKEEAWSVPLTNLLKERDIRGGILVVD